MTRPAPVLTSDNAGFWHAAKEHRLAVQQCRGCKRLLHPPRPMCPHCHGLESEFVDVAGTGTVYSYAVLHHPKNPSFTYPVLAAIVELDEGVRLVTNLANIDPSDIRIGLPVQVTFADTAEDMAVPVFEPRAE